MDRYYEPVMKMEEAIVEKTSDGEFDLSGWFYTFSCQGSSKGVLPCVSGRSVTIPAASISFAHCVESYTSSDDALAQRMVRVAGFLLILMFGCRSA